MKKLNDGKIPKINKSTELSIQKYVTTFKKGFDRNKTNMALNLNCL